MTNVTRPAACICIFIISWQSSCQFINCFRLSAHVTSVKFYPPCDCVPPWYRCRRGLQENRQALEAEGRVLRQRGRRSATPPSRGDVRLRAFRRLRSCRGKKRQRQSTRACRKIHRDRVSEDPRWQKGGACGVPRERLDARVAVVSVSLCMCAAWTREDGLD